jgi:hypothetical protein
MTDQALKSLRVDQSFLPNEPAFLNKIGLVPRTPENLNDEELSELIALAGRGVCHLLVYPYSMVV